MLIGLSRYRNLKTANREFNAFCRIRRRLFRLVLASASKQFRIARAHELANTLLPEPRRAIHYGRRYQESTATRRFIYHTIRLLRHLVCRKHLTLRRCEEIGDSLWKG